MLDKKMIAFGAVAVVAVAAVMMLVSGQKENNNKQKTMDETSSKPASSQAAGYVPQVEGVTIEVLAPGAGEKAVKKGDDIQVHYTGTLPDGTEFDSSVKRNRPISFRIGTGSVIPGWDQGLLGMQVGEKRKLTISPEMGYGAEANGPIPANSTLIFEVELLGIE
jgi:FKBP-type peptidyl-prolyl cis-trans isomerase